VDDALTVTRRSLHAVAELLLAGPQYRATGELRLAVTPGGFATYASPRVRVDGPVLVVPDRAPVAIHGRTARSLAAAIGVEGGRAEGSYSDGSGIGMDTPLSLRPKSVEVIMAAFGTGHEALARFEPGAAPILWPEHFDVAIRVGEINYGLSPGDGFIEEPYAYVGVAEPPADPFWNAPFGAARRLGQQDAAAVASFFHAGRDWPT
jgi:hypothetical protein